MKNNKNLPDKPDKLPKGKKRKRDIDPRRQRTLRIVKWMWIIFLLFMVTFFTFFTLVYHGIIGYMPDLKELEHPKDHYASIIYTDDGMEMGRFYDSHTNRIYADYDDISQNVIDALISTEDSRFEEHSGIDARAFARVVFKTLLMQDEHAGGGSTITQQLAKQLYSPPSDTKFQRAMQKTVEWMIALKLERLYSKEEILKMYLNQFDFLYNAIGISSAALVYFDKEAKDLTLAEAAMLVGMVKNPSLYNPVRFPERALNRRNTVLDLMVKNGRLSQAEANIAKNEPIRLHFNRQIERKEGIAPYFKEELRRMLVAKHPERENYSSEGAYLADLKMWEEDPLFGWAEKNRKADGSKYDIYNDGLKFYTTIDSRMQRYAEEAVNEQMRVLQDKFFREKRGGKNAPYSENEREISQERVQRIIKNAVKQSDRYRMMKKAGHSEEEIQKAFNTRRKMRVFSYRGARDTMMTPYDSIIYMKHILRTGIMAMDPRSGHVKAWVGGPDYNFFQYDMISTGRRQVGSTMKPFLYGYAMNEGYTPCSRFLNSRPRYEGWSPRSASGGRAGQMVDLRWALTMSNNWISARLLHALSIPTFINYLHDYGISGNIKPAISLCLGPIDISIREMVSGYTTFANNGRRTTPVMVTKIEDAHGNIVAEFRPKYTEVLSEKANDRILSMIMNVVNAGTGRSLRSAPYNLHAQMGGKTGTTNYNADGWFMGVTPDLVAGVWVGGEDRPIHFRSTADGQGSKTALPVFGRFMRKVYNDNTLGYSESTKFEIGGNLCDDGNEDPTLAGTGKPATGTKPKAGANTKGAATGNAGAAAAAAPEPEAAPAPVVVEHTTTIENVFD